MDPVVILDIGDLLPLGELWGTAIGFVVLMTAVVGAIGLGGRNMAVGAMGAYLTFTYYAVEANIGLLENILWVSLTMVILATVYKIWRLEGFTVDSA